VDSAGSLEELVSAVSARQAHGDTHWGGALDGNVDAGGRPWPWGGLGLLRVGVGERAAVQERVAAWVWRLEREKATWRSF